MLETNLVDFKSLALDPSPARKNELRDLLAELEKGTPEEGTPTDPGLAERR